MRRPFLHYCMTLADRWGWHIKEVMERYSPSQLMEWMAWDLTQSEVFQEKFKKDSQLEATRQMDGTDLAKMFRSMGGSHSYGNDR